MASASIAVNAANHSNLLTVDNIAEKWITQTATGVQREREIFNFKAAWFNIATVASIVSVALTIFTGSIAIAALTLLCWSTRAAFYKAVILTGTRHNSSPDAMMERLTNAAAEGVAEEIKEHLGIEDQDWGYVHAQFLDFPLWMNQAPAQQGAQQNTVAAATSSAQSQNALGNAPSHGGGGATLRANNADQYASIAAFAQSQQSAASQEAGDLDEDNAAGGLNQFHHPYNGGDAE